MRRSGHIFFLSRPSIHINNFYLKINGAKFTIDPLNSFFTSGRVNNHSYINLKNVCSVSNRPSYVEITLAGNASCDVKVDIEILVRLNLLYFKYVILCIY